MPPVANASGTGRTSLTVDTSKGVHHHQHQHTDLEALRRNSSLDAAQRLCRYNMEIFSMEAQGHREMVCGAFKDWTAGEPVAQASETEKLFLKDLYSYMKKRGSPIERIPNLGFKQIDLFLLFTTVRDMGGYQQVTAQQLWKQVYNVLGGNPRSTSAATCTRRHYERLLLPFEYQLKGLSLSTLPQHQHKHCHPSDYGSYGNEGPLPAKRKMMSVSLHQNPEPLDRDQYGSAFHVPIHYPRSPLLPPQLPTPPQPQPTFEPFGQTAPTQEPLDHLRYLAECYKNSSGLIEPLNLSVKGPKWESDSKPTSSFSRPLSSKNPKFLNKPSPLYTPQCSQVVESRRREVQSDEAGSGGPSHPFPTKCQEAYADAAASSSEAYATATWGQTGKGADVTAPTPSSPKTNCILEVKENVSKSPDVSELALTHVLPSLPHQNQEGEMEIEVPLSLLCNWLKVRRPPAAEREPKPEDPARQRWCPEAEDRPTNLTVHLNLQNTPQVSEDLRLRRRNTPAVHPSYKHAHASQPSLAPSLHLPPGCVLKNAVGKELFDEQDIIQSCSSRHPHGRDSHRQETAAPAAQRERTAPASSVLLLDSSSMPMLQLSEEEVVKLKRIISSSL